MDTKEKTLQELTIPAPVALDLLTGGAICAHAKDDLPSLNGIGLSAAAGVLKVVSTDRYRLITGEIDINDKDLVLDQILVPLDAVKRIISALKALPKISSSRDTVSLTRAGDILTVSVKSDMDNSSTITIALNSRGERDFPPYAHLFPADSVPVDSISFNPAYMAAFSKVPTSNRSGSILTFTLHGEKKPATVEIPHDLIIWKGLLMPMRGASLRSTN